MPPKIRIFSEKKEKKMEILNNLGVCSTPFYDADPQVDSGKSDRPYLRIEEE